MSIRTLSQILATGAILTTASLSSAATIGPLSFTEQSVFDDNFQIITEANPGFSVNTGAKLMQISSMSSTSAQPSSALYNSTSTPGADVFSGDVTVSGSIWNIAVPTTGGNDKRFTGLLLMVNDSNTLGYYARMSLDLATLEIGRINITNGYGWVSYSNLSLSGVEFGDIMSFNSIVDTDTNTVTLSASIVDRVTGVKQTTSTTRNYVDDSLNADGTGQTGVMLNGWQSVAVGLGSYKIEAIPEPHETGIMIGLGALLLALSLRRLRR